MQDAKTGGSRWVPDIREDEITEFQEQNGDETATYKAVNVHPIISRVLDKLAFFRTHVSAVWYNKLANKTVKDKLDEIDTSINSLNSSMNVTDVQIEETITPSTNRVKKSGNVISGAVGFTKSTTGWVTIGTIAAAPFAQYDFPLIRNNDGLHIGILRISENGTISAYSADAAGDVSASFSYISIMT